MRTQHAVRNIRLCTKDCLCLFVCPTGATDTENGQVDWDKCIGCGVCAGSCPSGALSMVPDKLPAQQKKDPEVVRSIFALAKEKLAMEMMAKEIAQNGKNDTEKLLGKAFIRSFRLQAEDLIREAGYMLPQSRNAHELLSGMIAHADDDFPKAEAEELLRLLETND